MAMPRDSRSALSSLYADARRPAAAGVGRSGRRRPTCRAGRRRSRGASTSVQSTSGSRRVAHDDHAHAGDGRLLALDELRVGGGFARPAAAGGQSGGNVTGRGSTGRVDGATPAFSTSATVADEDRGRRAGSIPSRFGDHPHDRRLLGPQVLAAPPRCRSSGFSAVQSLEPGVHAIRVAAEHLRLGQQVGHAGGCLARPRAAPTRSSICARSISTSASRPCPARRPSSPALPSPRPPRRGPAGRRRRRRTARRPPGRWSGRRPRHRAASCRSPAPRGPGRTARRPGRPASSASASLSGEAIGGQCQAMPTAASGTFSSNVRPAARVCGGSGVISRTTGSPAGTQPKYFRTFSFAAATSMSPAMTSVALFGT